MRRFMKWAPMLFVGLFMAAVLPTARADQANQLTYITTSAPIEIPGNKVLPSGTYAFKLLDVMGSRNIVQIFNKDQTHLYATIITVPDYRLQPTGQTVIRFAETPAGSPPALRAWFYPGDQYGQEFVYPKSRAVELAKASNEPVLSMPEETAANISEPIKSSKEAAAVALEKAPLKAEKPTGEEVEVAQVAETHPPATTTEAKNLPKTASELPSLAFGGILLILLGVGLRVVSARVPER